MTDARMLRALSYVKFSHPVVAFSSLEVESLLEVEASERLRLLLLALRFMLRRNN